MNESDKNDLAWWENLPKRHAVGLMKLCSQPVSYAKVSYRDLPTDIKDLIRHHRPRTIPQQEGFERAMQSIS